MNTTHHIILLSQIFGGIFLGRYKATESKRLYPIVIFSPSDHEDNKYSAKQFSLLINSMNEEYFSLVSKSGRSYQVRIYTEDF